MSSAELTSNNGKVTGVTRKAEVEETGGAKRVKGHEARVDDALARALGGVPTSPGVEEPSGPDYGVVEGDRLEVRWVVSSEDNDDGDVAGAREPRIREDVVWWPCTAVHKDDRWELHYDANVTLGFEAEVRVVRFTGIGTLEDVAGTGEHDDEADKNDDDPEVMTLRWRREGAGGGEDVDDGSDEDDDVVEVVDVLAMTPDADGNITLEAVVDAHRRADQSNKDRGREGLEEAGIKALSAMPMAQQQNIASAFVGLKEGLAHALQELMRTHGPDYVITKADIDTVMAGLRR